MTIEYKLFTPEVVAEKDLYLSPVGGFTIQPAVVRAVDRAGFSYGNDHYSARQDFKENLDGILIKQYADGNHAWYMNSGTLHSLKQALGLPAMESPASTTTESAEVSSPPQQDKH